MLKTGFSRVPVTPPLGTPMAGHPGTKLASGVLDDLYARAMVIDNDELIVALVSVDVVVISKESVARIRQRVSQADKRPMRVFISATHTHSGPLTTGLFGAAEQVDHGYLGTLESKIIQAIEEALRNLQSARLGFRITRVADLSFNARFLMKNGRIETHPFKGDPDILEQEGPADEEVLVLCAQDLDGNLTGALVNWANHPQVMERENASISADFPGWLEAWIRSSTSGSPVVLFGNGACGNLCPVNAQSTENIEVGLEWAQHMGKTLAAASLAACEAATIADDLSIHTRTVKLGIPLRDLPDKLVADSTRFLERNAGVEFESVLVSNWGIETGKDREKVLSLEEYLSTPSWKDQEARDVLALVDQKRRQPCEECELSVVALGDLAIVMLPFELFVEHGLEIKKRSPFEYTMVIELANGYSGYVPTTKAFSRPGGYETLTLTSSRMVENAGEMVVEKVVQMLGAMHITG